MPAIAPATASTADAPVALVAQIATAAVPARSIVAILGLYQVLVGGALLIVPHWFPATALPPAVVGASLLLAGTVLIWIRVLPRSGSPVSTAGKGLSAVNLGLLSADVLTAIDFGLLAADGLSSANFGLLAAGASAGGDLHWGLIWGILGLSAVGLLFGHLRPGGGSRTAWRNRPFATVVELAALATGALMLLAPVRYDVPAYAAVRPWLPAFGAAFVLLGGGLLVTGWVKAAPWVARVGRFLLAATLLLFGLGLAQRSGWPGTLTYVLFSLAVADVPLPVRWELAAASMGPVRRRVVLVTATALIGSALALTLVVTATGDASARRQIEIDSEELAESVAAQLRLYLDDHLRAIQVAAEAPSVETWDLVRAEDALTGFFDGFRGFENIALVDRTGQQVLRVPPATLIDLSSRGDVQAALVGEDGVYGGVQPSIRNGEPWLMLATAVRNPTTGETIGAISAPLTLGEVGAFITTLSGKYGSEIQLTDERGVLVTDSLNPVPVSLAGGPTSPVIERLRQGGGTLTYSSDGVRYLAGFEPVPDWGWGVVVQRPEADALASVWRVRELAYVALVGGSALLVVLSLFLAHVLMRPIVALLAPLAALGRGRYDVELPSEREGEIGDLIGAFGRVRDVLRDREARLLERNRELVSTNRLKDEVLTARQHAAEAQLRLAAIVDSSEDAILSKELDGTIVSWNGAAERLYGYAAAEAVGRNIRLLLPPDRETEGADVLRRVAAGEAIEPYESRRQTKDGRILDVALTVSPVRDADGHVVGASAIARDITARRQAEAALRLRDRAIASTKNGIVIADARRSDCPIIDVNPAFERMTGYAAAEVVGRNCRFLQGLGTDPSAVAEVRRAIAERRECEVTLLNYRKNGTPFWNNLYVAPVHDEAGELTHFVGIQNDVDERKRAEEVRAQLAAIVNSSDDAILSKTLDGTIVSWNDGAERLYGYVATEAVGRNICMLLPAGHEDELPKILERVGAGEPIDQFETRRVTKDGRTLDVGLTISPVRNTAGAIIGASTIARDITARKRLEAENAELLSYTRGLIDANLDTLVIVENDGTITHLNAATERMLGRSRDELLGTNIFSYMVDADAARDGLAIVLQNGEIRDFPTELRHRDGGVTPVLWNATVYLDRSGRPAGVVGAARDISERRKVEQALLEARDSAEHANRLKGEFLSTMSHELRTPLTSIIGYSHLMLEDEDDPPSPQQAADLQRITRSADHLLGLVNHVLDLAKIESGRIDLEPERLSLAPLLVQVVGQVAPLAAKKGIALAVEPRPDLPAVWADPTRVVQILLNLVGNAVKFTEHGGVSLGVRTMGEAVEISVTDTGIGISSEALAHIFEPFRQADGSTTRRFGGTGLGLSIARHLAEIQGGSLTATSTPGRGSAFTLRLPAANGRATGTSPLVSAGSVRAGTATAVA